MQFPAALPAALGFTPLGAEAPVMVFPVKGVMDAAQAFMLLTGFPGIMVLDPQQRLMALDAASVKLQLDAKATSAPVDADETKMEILP